MNGAIRWFANNRVAANLMMVGIVAAGILTLPDIRQEVFPEISTDRITVTVPYPGAAPEEVEEGITVRVEEQLVGIDGIKKITSTSSEGSSSVVAELYENADSRWVLDEIKSRVDAIDTFPVDAEEPSVRELLIKNQVLNVAVSGPANERSLKVLAQRVRDDLSSLSNISHVELSASRAYEISIEISEVALQRYNLTFDEVVRAVRAHSQDLPGGSIKTRAGEILLRSKGQAYTGTEFAEIPVRSQDGWRLRVGDVAEVVDGFRETDLSTRFDGHPSVIVKVYRSGEQNALEISETVRAYIADVLPRMPAGVELTVWQDDSELLRGRRDLLLRNGRDGFVLVLIVLALFLQARVALWVAVGVPIALLGAIWMLPTWDVSINLLSLFAFIVVLGILVDDAIVTGENIFRHRERGDPPVEASVRGTQEIAVPVVFGVLTTMAAFAPMLFMPGPFGRIVRVIPAVVLTALIFSIIESKFILPAHLAHSGMAPRGQNRPKRAGLGAQWNGLQARVAAGMDRFVDRYYRPVLSLALQRRVLTLAIALSVVIVAVAYTGSGHIRFTFFPKIEGDDVVAVLTMPVGTPKDVTQVYIKRLEETAREVIEQVDREEPGREGLSNVRHVLATIGDQPFRTRQSHGPTGGKAGASGGHVGEVHMSLQPSELRDSSAAAIADLWREITGPMPEAVELTFTADLVRTGDSIHVQLRGSNTRALRQAAADVEAQLLKYPGLHDITDSFREGKQELKLRIHPSADALGLTLADLGRQVRQAFYGAEVQKIQRGRDELRVMVRFPERERRSLGDIEAMRIRLPDGTAVPFGSVAEAELSRGFASIQRSERRRIIDVTADIDPGQANANQIVADLSENVLPSLVSQYDGIDFSLEGEQREQSNTLEKFRAGFALSLLAIFALLAIPLRSYLQPLVVMSAIPFGLVGALIGHVVMGLNLSMLSMFGVLAAAGVVVNDSLVLVTFINRRRAEGMSLHDAVCEAGVVRFRAIFLTSLTTFLGLTPVMLEQSLHARFLIPMAVSLAYGVGCATFVTLLVVPTLTMALEDVKSFVIGLFRDEATPDEAWSN